MKKKTALSFFIWISMVVSIMFFISSKQQAFGQFSNLNISNVNTTTVTDTVSPSVPTSLKADVISSSQINLQWNPSVDNVGVTGYRVFRSLNTGTAVFAVVKITNTNSYSAIGLIPNTTYIHKVSAFDAANNESQPSDPVSATTLSQDTGLKLLWSFNPQISQAQLVLGSDANRDGASDLIVGEPFGKVFMLNTKTVAPIWSNSADHFVSVIDGTIPAAVKKNVIVAKEIQGTASYYVKLLIGNNGSESWSKKITGKPAAVKTIGDLNGDGILDIAIGFNDGANTKVTARLGHNGQSIWTRRLVIQGNIKNIDVLFNTATNAYLVASGENNSGAPYLVALSNGGRVVYNHVPAIGSMIKTIGQYSGVPFRDILVKNGTSFYRVNGSDGSSVQWQYDSCYDLYSVSLFPDIDNDGWEDILAFGAAFNNTGCPAGQSNVIKLISGQMGIDLASYPLASNEFFEVAPANGDMSGDGTTDILAAGDGKILVINSMNGQIIDEISVPGTLSEITGLDPITVQDNVPDVAVFVVDETDNSNTSIQAYGR